ncbi:double-strand break repair protein AddB [Rhodobacteraceae bacterium LMO-12]|nr:double-strand break repair protein AddB [Rhodobacteraceae bacterium LMO-JJ12]
MFEPHNKPRVFAIAPGVDFPRALVSGLLARHTGKPPEALARVELIVNTRRMARRIHALFDDGPALLLPRIRLITDLGDNASLDDIPPAVAPLRRRLELVQLVSGFLEAAPDFAPRSALFDLADSLAGLMAEMQGEGVSPEDIAALDIEDQSGHWGRTQTFLGIVQSYFDQAHAAPDGETRQRLIIEQLAARWAETPPEHPIIIAGSTGSRGATQLLMRAVARLPQGALVLPGFDFDMPEALWPTLNDPLIAEDHPQFRFHALMKALDLKRRDIARWADTAPPNPARNALVSLALRPAPITDQWMEDGPKLVALDTATADMTLLEAPTQREEALAIALCMRQAAEAGEVAALITPDRTLTRQVSAALDRWDILPDDSAGQPLPLSAIGRLMRHIAGLFEAPLTAESLLTLLKHPLTHSAANRGEHLRFTHELELYLRAKGPPYPDAEALRFWAATRKAGDANHWIEWVIDAFCGHEQPGEAPFEARLEAHLELIHLVIRGSDADATPQPWDHAAGQEAHKIVLALSEAADAGGEMTAFDYSNLFGSVLAGGEVRQVETPHPEILIWGTLEARVQGADLLILGGLNEGSWPEPPSPDPWLNRKMRHDAGLLLPERRIGLSAHDFQQAIAAPKVVLSRSVKSDEAENVPSRWLNRMVNLLGGLPDQGGDKALAQMKTRGAHWLNLARALEEPIPVPPAPRPAPRPPVAARPRKLSVTQIKRLIRDPYAIYARHVLRLRPLDPLMRAPDALTRGIVLHEVMEQFVRAVSERPETLARDYLLDIARTVLANEVPWPAARLMWLARIERVADSFLADEAQRQKTGTPLAYETHGKAEIERLGFTLTCMADRIDQGEQGLLLYDYKTGSPPTPKEQTHFDKQLLLETVIAEKGGFREITAAPVAGAYYIGLGAGAGQVAAPIESETPEKVWAEFETLIARYLSHDQGYLSRRAMFRSDELGDYDQLARFGEWDITDDPEVEVLK